MKVFRIVRTVVKYALLALFWYSHWMFKLIITPFMLYKVFHQLTKKYINPYKTIMYIGKRGAGKSTMLSKIALKYMRKGIPVYSTMPINGTYKLDYKDVGQYEFEKNSIVLIDEVGMIWDNRKFKEFSDDVRDWFKLQRHRRITVVLFSQAYDVDVKIRKLVDSLYIISNNLRVFSYATKINTKIVINKSTAEAGSKIDEDLVKTPFIFFFLGNRQLTFIPKYIKYFNSYEAPPLKDKDFELWGPPPPDVQKALAKRNRKKQPVVS